MNLETCYTCGAVYEIEEFNYPGTHVEWHNKLDQIISFLQMDIEYLQRELDGKVDSDG